MTYRWIWTITCEKHKFHSDHYKRSIVLTAIRSHMRQMNCIEISPDEIKRIPAPDDADY